MNTIEKPTALAEGRTVGLINDTSGKSNKTSSQGKKTFIPIDQDYAIGADQYSWHLLKRKSRKRDGESVTEWQPIKWFISLESAVNGFADYSLRVSEVSTVCELAEKQKSVFASLCKALHPKFKVVEAS